MATELFPDPEYLDKAEDLDFAVAFARIECHYFINAIFVEEAYILNHAERFSIFQQLSYKVAMTWFALLEVHGSYTKAPDSKLVMVGDAGHSMGEVSIARELVAATDAIQR